MSGSFPRTGLPQPLCGHGDQRLRVRPVFATERRQRLARLGGSCVRSGPGPTRSQASNVEEQTWQGANTPAAAPPAGAQQPLQQQLDDSGAGVCRSCELPPESSLTAAVQALSRAVQAMPQQYAGTARGLVRVQVPVPRSCKALWWLRGQAGAQGASSLLHPMIFFSPRRSTAPETEGSRRAGAASAGAGSVAGAGAAWLWQGPAGTALDETAVGSMQRFVAAAPPRVRIFGGGRFDPKRAPAPEWQQFGSYYFVLPRLEFTEASGCGLLACTVAWDAQHSSPSGEDGMGFTSLEAAAMDALAALGAVQPPMQPSAGALRLQCSAMQHFPDEQRWSEGLEAVHPQLQPAVVSGGSIGSGALGAAATVSTEAAHNEYLLNGQQGLDDLLAALDGGFEAASGPNSSWGSGDQQAFTKVVLARRTDVQLAGRLDPLALLEALQERDPRAYQVLLQLPSGATFLASTPECLYTRSGDAVASEAVAGTRARGAGGDVEKDFWLSLDLLRSPKDHMEFGVVRDWVRSALGEVCEDVQVEVAKSVLKQGAVQHLYGRLAARLKPGRSDAHLLAALHPTPAVCGQPRMRALHLLRESESFDRGFYAGPFGWISHGAAEFVVAIRSALVRPAREEDQAPGRDGDRAASHAAAGPGPGSNGVTASSSRTAVSLFAGVGIVSGSDTASEWAELDLKVSQYERLLRPAPVLADAPNTGTLWAGLVVEELCRLGCNTFCVAPGSRSSPLTTAIARHPRARIVPCIDERSLGFWALGHSRACGRPAVVVTSSGTAVANLLPAVVEASQSNIPLLLLTADRPSELRDTGANQTIDQVGIFGSYTRWACDVQPPTDQIPARSVVSTVDSAVRHATSPTAGPVHLNYQFREPLTPAAAPWNLACLAGLQRWEQGDAPYTRSTAIPTNMVTTSGGAAASAAGGSPSGVHAGESGLQAVLSAVHAAQRGLIVAGELTTPEDCVAAVQLAQRLGWPMAADVLSGLRAGAHAAAGAPLAVLPHFDQLLLDRTHWAALRPDVVLQLGGHVTSKRTAQFLEWCAMGSSSSGTSGSSEDEAAPAQGTGGKPPTRWIFVDRTPKRHDQGHLVTDRIQATLPALSAAITAAAASGGRPSSSAAPGQAIYTHLLAALEAEAGAAVDAALAEMHELTEPQVARLLSEELPPGEGLFLGNSMPIRDADMYTKPPWAAGGLRNSPCSGAVASGVGAPVAANRGASGIDGVLSTAAGFADGLGRGCTLVVGDISFLHDVNGLNLLRSGEMRPPLTVVLVNNGGGGIFSFLPIADELPEDVFTPLWATPQHVDLQGLCRAQGIPHVKVASTQELRSSLHSAWGLNRHSVIEVATDRRTNVQRHRQLQAAVQHAVSAALAVLAPAAAAAAAPAAAGSARQAAVHSNIFTPVVGSCSFRRFSLALAKPLTTAPGREAGGRQGLYLKISIEAGGREAQGVGEVSPLPGLHAESLQQAEQQVALLCELLSGAVLPATTALLGGRLSRWLERSVGLTPAELLPSVRFGLEGAVLSALAQLSDVSLTQLIATASSGGAPAAAAAVNGLLDCSGGPEEAAEQARALVARGFSALKIKVARRDDPLKDAAAVLAVRQAVGPDVVLRADANQRWTLDQALRFGAAAAAAELQYVEEPVADAASAAEFYRATGIPVALDESIDQGWLQTGEALPSGVATVVLKPSALGGIERTMEVATWAQRQGASAVISSAFESPLGVWQLGQVAAALDPGARGHHGLATLDWFLPAPQGGTAAGSSLELVHAMAVAQSGRRHMEIAAGAVPAALAHCWCDASSSQQGGCERLVRVSLPAGEFALRMIEVSPAEALQGDLRNGNSSNGSINGSSSSIWEPSPAPAVVFLHGFLGSSEEWLPQMRALATAGRRCISLDLPGHGGTSVSGRSAQAFSLEAAAEAVAAALGQCELHGCTLVGYSLGARVALLLAARSPSLVSKVVALSGSAGVEGGADRAGRAASDDAQAAALQGAGLAAFLGQWYRAPMWAPLRRNPRFAELLQRREAAGDAVLLSRALAGMSPGRAPAVRGELAAAAAEGSLPQLLLISGQLDAKFVALNERLAAEINAQRGGSAQAVVVPDCGHATHVERPLELLSLLHGFV